MFWVFSDDFAGGVGIGHALESAREEVDLRWEDRRSDTGTVIQMRCRRFWLKNTEALVTRTERHRSGRSGAENFYAPLTRRRRSHGESRKESLIGREIKFSDLRIVNFGIDCTEIKGPRFEVTESVFTAKVIPQFESIQAPLVVQTHEGGYLVQRELAKWWGSRLMTKRDGNFRVDDRYMRWRWVVRDNDTLGFVRETTM
ncbi:hypothetical protein U1Q18_046868 [Sarracenia purpurea var. burkii]